MHTTTMELAERIRSQAWPRACHTLVQVTMDNLTQLNAEIDVPFAKRPYPTAAQRLDALDLTQILFALARMVGTEPNDHAVCRA